jgi:hypothetical protein
VVPQVQIKALKCRIQNCNANNGDEDATIAFLCGGMFWPVCAMAILSTICSAWAEFDAVRTDPTPCCTPMSTSFDVTLARHWLNPFHFGFSGVFMLCPCVPTLASVLPFGHGFFSGVLLAAFRIPLARSSSSDCLAPLALVPTYCKAPTIGTGAFSGISR